MAAGLTDQQTDRARQAVDLVHRWLQEASHTTPNKSAQMLADVLRDPHGLEFTVGFVDGVVRPEDVHVAARTLQQLSAQTPVFLPRWMRTAIQVGAVAAPVLPQVVVPIARRVMRRMVDHLVIDATPDKLTKAIARLRSQGVDLNLNLLGEAVLGKVEASARLEGTCRLLARDDVDYVSLKVSSSVAPHNPWAFDVAVDDIVGKLTPLFTIAATANTRKFINLDMEEYRDLDLTIAVFTKLLDRPQFLRLSAGVVLQAYLPDALAAMIRLQEWSAVRRERGGADIKVRVVKGANLPMETVEARLHGWPLATWHSKRETDTNYKRILNFAMTPERIANVRLGVAGHNLFDIAYSWLTAQERGVGEGVEYEMLLGMAESQARAVQQTVGNLRLYTPVVSPQHFDVAIAYLVRRLEESAASDNFMSAVFDLNNNPELFEREKTRFLKSLQDLDEKVPAPHRLADRYAAVGKPTPGHFHNTPDTDPAVAANREWAARIIRQAPDSTAGIDTIKAAAISDPQELDQMLAKAHAGGKAWGRRPAAERAAILRNVGAALEQHRAELIEVSMSETVKTVDQADPEVSEAVDFAYYYADCAQALELVDGARFEPSALTLITPPWNFPLSIPAGSTLAALAAGSAAILKPAPTAKRCGAVLADVMWQAGVPRDALTLIDISENDLGRRLIRDQRIDRVILTGAYETAQLFKSFRPGLPLLAETSGKNAIIVTPSADLDLAVKDIVNSAFGHAGQKCSAASLVILVGSVAQSRRLRNQLVDAVTSLTVGSPFDPATQVSRLIEPPTGKLLRGLTELGPGESWLVRPHQIGDDKRLWSPGIRIGVQRDSEYHRTEYFGPILGIMTAKDLDEAIELVNDIDYGLTSGIHSLDPAEIQTWLDRVEAGNLYVNRGITGAIVRRQPFGGWKRSSVGNGCKAGGPNYLTALGNWHPSESHPATVLLPSEIHSFIDSVDLPHADRTWLIRCAHNDAIARRDVFSTSPDVSALEVERNIFRYRHLAEPLVIRLAEQGSVTELIRVITAGLASGSPFEISTETDLPPTLITALDKAKIRHINEDHTSWTTRLNTEPVTRVRAIGTTFAEVTQQANGRADLAIWAQPVTESGRIEMLPFLREQAISLTAHRFGTPNPAIASLI